MAKKLSVIFVLPLVVSLCLTKPLSAATHTRLQSKGLVASWSFEEQQDVCTLVTSTVTASEDNLHQGSTVIRGDVLAVSVGRYNTCTGETEFSGFGIGDATLLEFDTQSHVVRVSGVVTVHDDTTGDPLDITVSLGAQGFGAISYFNEHSRTVETDHSHNFSHLDTWQQSAVVLDGSYVRDDLGRSYESDPAVATLNYTKQYSTMTIVH